MLDRDRACCRRLASADSGASAPATVTLDLVLLLDSDRAAMLGSEDTARSATAAAGWSGSTGVLKAAAANGVTPRMGSPCAAT